MTILHHGVETAKETVKRKAREVTGGSVGGSSAPASVTGARPASEIEPAGEGSHTRASTATTVGGEEGDFEEPEAKESLWVSRHLYKKDPDFIVFLLCSSLILLFAFRTSFAVWTVQHVPLVPPFSCL